MSKEPKILGPQLTRLVQSPRWGDLDALNHVNNAAFLSYIEEARVRWFSEAFPTWASDREGPLLAAVQIDYRRPILWPSKLYIDLHGGRVGRTSMTVDHVIRDASDGQQIHAEGHSVLVWVDYASGRPVPWPEALSGS